MKTAAIILAAGSGTRFGTEVPKQFLNIGSKTILEMSTEAFDKNASVDCIYIVVSKAYRERAEDLLKGYSKVKAIVEGGSNRVESAIRGFDALSVIDEDAGPTDEHAGVIGESAGQTDKSAGLTLKDAGPTSKDAKLIGEGCGVERCTGFDIVLVHDAARPFLSQRIIDDIVALACDKGAAVPGVSVKDTIKVVNEDGSFRTTLRRDELYGVQTPQGFRYELLKRAYESVRDDATKGTIDATDDAMLVEKLGEKVYLVLGEDRNRKITTLDDLEAANAMSTSDTMSTANAASISDTTSILNTGDSVGTSDAESSRDSVDFINVAGIDVAGDGTRVGIGFDTHELVEGRKLILGGIEIPHKKGLHGHSDADVLTHAVMDALLGAASLGDIGKHFPDTDPKYKGADSMVLLERVVAMIDGLGYEIGNIDTTVMAERPKLAPHKDAIRNNLAHVLKIHSSDVGVKATTTEGLGYVGREEGISTQAIVILKEKIK